METLQAIYQHQLIAIIRGVPPKDAVKIGSALKEGGIRLVEMTLNSPDAFESIRLLSRELGREMKIGAGTVLDPEAAFLSIQAGADFILSPTVKAATIEMTKRYGKVSIPGAYTPTEILSAYELGADIVKVFPASGPGYIKDIRGPLSHIPLLPTGGVNDQNIAAFKQAGAVGFGIGSSLVDGKAEVTPAFLRELTAKAKNYVAALEQTMK
ncbi:bifunctional 4-hydroxy-2-oxoglutarate aldolase/2-dehydro-3-deoxy-phosphogluconate aldolase [Shouchella clausii]|uniref:2-dehydro-3-deoxyphosphogluconate aldolase n=1 Tax=Shouchella clausii (strain KSM-K16) TaxID=66692 RepID=Q5WKP2_SHOC1|nr:MULTISPECIES: bifunctional 4-hydroxy-2-oxoglutarate aldolase/2-dehydro-3-deoxy-phosphogluconate aldolase [Shouchella]ALA52343.1 4-hydroxy-2-oxoglutarate aldolase [Shouchella clausii]KKI88349.1 2-dehydro-3-deoxyphosphogluconate aldolase [Shouchella clausii]MBU3230223.1 bifunctional 4-hydroxy-2-oxoglutarate aldolase/2-dehydro-3-deoxy-phosphogluconate aldolase [Shouchella clausii]MBU3262578.1 bifunctional 4-hydroxy-2-oxoglutarate aldolase/2-dehydro-3-deoxy-phosphogluconate aldolase [Shouchella 